MIPISDIYKNYTHLTAALPLLMYNRRKYGVYNPYTHQQFDSYPYSDGIASYHTQYQQSFLMQQYLLGVPKQITPELVSNGITQEDMYNPLLEFQLFGHTFQMRCITFVHIDQPFSSYAPDINTGELVKISNSIDIDNPKYGMRNNFAYYINTLVSLKGTAENVDGLRWTPISQAPEQLDPYNYFKGIRTGTYSSYRIDGITTPSESANGIGGYTLLRGGNETNSFAENVFTTLHDTYDNDGNRIFVRYKVFAPYDINSNTTLYPEYIKNEILNRAEDFKLFMDAIILNSFDMYYPRESTFISYSETNPRTFYIKQTYSCDFINQGNVVNYV